MDRFIEAILQLDISEDLLFDLGDRSVDELTEIMDKLEPFGLYHVDNMGYLLVHCGYYNGKRYPVNVEDIAPPGGKCFAEFCFVNGVIYTNINDKDYERCRKAHIKEYGEPTMMMRVHDGTAPPGFHIVEHCGVKLVECNLDID